MKTLNKDFYTYCSINYNDYILETDDIIKIPNFFKSIEDAKEFLKNLNVWETSIYDNHSKPGSEGIMPSWTTRFLLERFFLKFDINCDYNSFFSCVNHFYKDIKIKKNITSSTLFPHVDGYELIENGEKLLNYIVLINLNDEPITTNFWEFNNKNFVENKDESLEYDKFVSKYSKVDWNVESIEIPKELKIVKEVAYEPNEAIVYPANVFHSVKLEKSHEKNNPRVSLRLSYIAKVKKFSLDRKYTKIDTIKY